MTPAEAASASTEVGRMVRRSWSLSLSVCFGMALSAVVLAGPHPVRADTPCAAIANKPTAPALEVTFSGHALCTGEVESLRVHVNGFYRPVNASQVTELVTATTECFEFGGVRCPVRGEATATHTLPRGCFYYWTNVVIDVMYKGSLVYIDHVDSQNSTSPGDPGAYLCGTS